MAALPICVNRTVRHLRTGAGVTRVGWLVGDGRGSDLVLLSRKTAYKDDVRGPAGNLMSALMSSALTLAVRRGAAVEACRKGTQVSAFKDADEVYAYIGKMFEIAVADPAFVEATKDTGLVVLLTQTDPDATILIDFPGQKVLFGDAAAEAKSTVQLRMSSDNSNRFWQGKLNFTLAMAQRKVKLDGKRSVALKLLPLTTPLFDTYQTTLREAGRDDLLVG
jgi:putative sterol carrier protein